MRKHAFLSCSGSHKWTQCSKSPWLELSALKEEVKDNDPAQIGTMIHKYAEEQLNKIIYNKPIEDVGFVPDNTRDIVDGYVNYVREISDDFKSSILTEHMITLDYIISGGFGIADCVVIKNNKKEVHVIDLKTGSNKIQAENNTQLYLYLIGIRQNLALFKNCTFFAHIYQPTIRHSSVVKLTNEDLDKFEDFIRLSVKNVYHDPKTTPGKHCAKHYCKARVYCKAYQEYVSNPLNNVEVCNIDVLSIEDITKIIDYGQEYAKWIEGVIKDVKTRIANNTFDLPGYQAKVVNRRSLIKDKAKVISCLESLGLTSDEYMTYDIASLTQLEKILGKDDKVKLSEIVENKPLRIELKKINK